MLVDCFLFFHELDLLEIRLDYLYEHVDKFIIVEACQSFSGKRKDFNFEKNIKRYEKYLNKIIYFKINDFHKSTYDFYKYISKKNNHVTTIMNQHDHYNKNFIWWVLDSYHRECIHLALMKECQVKDNVIISDLDEIPSLEIIEEVKIKGTKLHPIRCLQYEFKYFLNSFYSPNWAGSIIAPYSYLKNKSLNHLRMELYELEHINKGGYHFTSLGGEKALIKKIENWGHQEFNLKLIKENLFNNLLYGRDVFYRFGHHKSRLIDLGSNEIFDERIRKILLNYEDLVLINNKKESIFYGLNYRYIQILVYLIHIKNHPKKVFNKLVFYLKKIKKSFTVFLRR